MENVEGQGRPKQKRVASESAPAGSFKRVFKGQREVIHDLFELKEAIFKQNVSYKFLEPQLVDIKHKHFFHSVDRRGIANQVSSDNSGHFHYLEIKADAEGNMTVTCGPPMRNAIKKVKGKDRVVVEPVFYGAKNPTDEDAVVDDHTHEIAYVQAEKLEF